MDRRQFLRTTGRYIITSAAVGAADGRAWAATPEAGPGPSHTLPEHLPKRLSIGMFIWNWVTMATPGEPYHDLEKVMAGLRERGFNAVRADAGLNWCYRLDGRPRGEMDQDSSWLVADPKIRAEVMGIPEEKRFTHLARQHDRLLRAFKDKGLHRNIAFVEVHNEPDASLFPQGAEGKRLHADAIAFLRNAHPDILVSGDYCSHNPAIVPDNAQVYDQHTYVADLYWTALYGQTIWHKDFDPVNPRKIKLLDRILKDKIVPYREFVRSA